MFESTKTICTPWKAKYIGCSGSVGSVYFYTFPWVRNGIVNGNFVIRKFCVIVQSLLSLFDDNGVSVSKGTALQWKDEWNKYNHLPNSQE